MTVSATEAAPTSNRLRLGVVGLAAAAAALAVLPPLGAAVLVIGAAAFVWLRDPVPDSWRAPLYLLFAFLPVSTVLMLTLGAAAGEISRPIAWSPLWREALVFGVLAIAATAAVVQRRPRLGPEDALAIGLGALVLAYAALGLGSRGHELSLLQRAFGTRAWLLPIALYLLGRVTPSSAMSRDRDFRLLIRLVALVTATAFLEFFLLGDRFWQQLGFADYLRQTGTSEAGIFRGVTFNYYTIAADGTPVRRWPAFMGTLNLGFWFVAALCLLAAYLWTTRRQVVWALIAVAAVALVGSRTRAAMAGLLIALPCLALIAGRKHRWMIVGAVALATAAIALNVRPELAQAIALRLRLPLDPSALGHLAAIVHGTQAVLQQPLGLGIGTAGYVGAGFAEQGTQAVGESLYLSLATELGWLGVMLFVAWVAVSAWRLGAYALKTPVRGSNWALAAGLAVATLGYVVASVTTEVWRGLQAGALYWWLLGTAITMARDAAARPT